ncbi:VPLPA-CTERM sorting domain-containing protein [Epibacterium ulvae]|uniref:VPLPA-CTERM sorting domain-containing protein n=1 Tax=Epibacterium ulvae TaxID=1156985 RepID=UPI001BFC0802|nr:VPLPA-CTERM sorting domain-containing protein [Epibacterium ulvae]MBT8152586.1 VPLPA-CTERM sorting domain-containing protein [Epibacterium ulvae]
MPFKFKILSTIAATLLAGAVQAATIVSYDIRNADPSFTGGWTNTFDGTITPSAEGIPGLVDLIGGSGTLNDGILPASSQNNQLFLSTLSLQNASITLYFARAIRLGTIEFQNNPVHSGNSILGGIREVTAIGGGGDFFAAAEGKGFGPIGSSGFEISDRFDFSDTPFADVELTSITLRNFFVDETKRTNAFNIGEIVVTEAVDVAPVPLPASGMLFLGALAGFGMLRRPKQG